MTQECEEILLYLTAISESEASESFVVQKLKKDKSFVPYLSWSNEKPTHAVEMLTALWVDSPSLELLYGYLRIIPRFINLSSIRITGVPFSMELITLFCSSMTPNAAKLKRLQFEDTHMDKAEFAILCDLLVLCVNLERVYLSHNHINYATTSSLSKIMNLSTRAVQFTHIYLPRNQMKDGQLELFLKNLQNVPNLRCLDLSYNEATGYSLPVFGELIATIPLNSLTLDGNSLGTGTMLHFHEFSELLSRSKIGFLSLDKNGITNDQFVEILRGIERKKSRISLDVKNNIIGDGIEALGPLLLQHTFLLENINLRGNSLPNSALVSLAAKLKDCKASLRTLNLSKNNIPLATGSLLLRSCVLNNNVDCKINLDENPACESLMAYQSLVSTKVKGQVYGQHLLVSLAVLGKESDREMFQKMFRHSNTLKSKSGLYQLPGVFEKSVRDYYYTLYHYDQRSYFLYGRLLRFCSRVAHVVLGDLKEAKLISQLRSWVSLIETNEEDTVYIVFALIVDPKLTITDIELKERSIHELISELCYEYKHIIFCSRPLFVTKKVEKQTYFSFQEHIKSLIDANPIYLPKKMIEVLLPSVKVPKIMKKADLIQYIRKRLNVDAMDALSILQTLQATEVIVRLDHEWMCMDPKLLHSYLFSTLQELSPKQCFSSDGNECVFSIQQLTQQLHVPTELQFQNARQIFLEFLVYQRILFFSESVNSVFLPGCLKSCQSKDRNNPYQFMDSSKEFALGRRLLFPPTQSLPSYVWFTIQSHFVELFTKPQRKNDWSWLLASDCIRISNQFGYEFRLYFHLDFSHSEVMRIMEIHIIGVTLEGVVELFQSVASELHQIFIRFSFEKYLIGVRILQPKDIFKWYPEIVQSSTHTFGLSQLLLRKKRSSLSISAHLLIPDILSISPENSNVTFNIEDKEITIEIILVDVRGNLRAISDNLQVILISKIGQRYFCEKNHIQGDSLLLYSHQFEDDDDVTQFLLVVTLPTQPVPIGNTPVPLMGNTEELEKILLHWKEYWEPLYEIDTVHFSNKTEKYIQYRDAQLEAYILRKLATPGPIDYSHLIENVSELEYLQICVDASAIAEFTYLFEPKDFAYKHRIQRALNRYQFFYKPEHQQKYKVFFFSPPVNLWLMSGATCFYTFERGGDLYIAIRGTKTPADILADLKYSLTPYKSESDFRVVSGTYKSRFLRRTQIEKEMIHNGFSRYAEIIIRHFRESYSELLSNSNEKRRLIICGHSLGGGISQVIARKLIEQKWDGPLIVVTFGSPLIGNNLYCNWKGWRTTPNLKMFNFANQKDPVTNLLVRSWSVFSKIGVAPKLDFGYTSKYLYVFSCNTSSLQVIEHDQVIDYLTNQVAWNPKDLHKYVLTHTSSYYWANIKKLLDDYLDSTKVVPFVVP